jgi:hypothetical protein
MALPLRLYGLIEHPILVSPAEFSIEYIEQMVAGQRDGLVKESNMRMEWNFLHHQECLVPDVLRLKMNQEIKKHKYRGCKKQ